MGENQPGEEERTYECSDCGRRLRAAHQPGECPNCGGSMTDLGVTRE